VSQAQASASPARSLGLRLPAWTIPTISWAPWQVVDRAHGFHVSRESIGGTAREFLRNEVGDVKVFRKAHLATAACAAANFTSTAETLSAEPLLGRSGS
jgi:hypothetical protein